jgi:hypothetical protein
LDRKLNEFHSRSEQRGAKRNTLPGLKLNHPAQQAKIAKIVYNRFQKKLEEKYHRMVGGGQRGSRSSSRY